MTAWERHAHKLRQQQWQQEAAKPWHDKGEHKKRKHGLESDEGGGTQQQQQYHQYPKQHKGGKRPRHQHQHPKASHENLFNHPSIRKLNSCNELIQGGPDSPAATAAALSQQGGVAPVPTKGGRHYTVSIAVAGSILLNAQSPELRTYLVGEIARAAAIFQVDEVVVYGDESAQGRPGWGDPSLFFARVLQYMEMPQYLRKALLPHHPDLRLAGLLNPLDAPHHPRAHERLPYREGVTLETPAAPAQPTPKTTPNGGGSSTNEAFSLVNVGLRKDVRLDRRLRPGVRVTVKLDPRHDPPSKGVAVAPSAPREEAGLYWGYTTRVAKNLAEVFSGGPFKGGYDLTLGTSERGHQTIDDEGFALPSFRHLLVVFGGVAGLEACVDASEDMRVPASKTHTLFDVWLNVCPEQGSRTIRTEEAVPITLARLRPLIKRSGAKGKETAAAAAAGANGGGNGDGK